MNLMMYVPKALYYFKDEKHLLKKIFHPQTATF